MTATIDHRPAEALATVPQRNYLNSLLEGKDLSAAGDFYQVEAADPDLTKRRASWLIDQLKQFDWKPRNQEALPGTEAVEKVTLEDGMYMLDREVFKVQHAIHGSGNQYAKRLELSEPDCADCVNGDTENCVEVFGHPCAWGASFVYAPGVIRKLRPEHRMSLEEAKAFGAVYGTCAACGRTLTNEASIEAGIGPVCAKRF